VSARSVSGLDQLDRGATVVVADHRFVSRGGCSPRIPVAVVCGRGL